jgi:hypothetical protein
VALLRTWLPPARERNTITLPVDIRYGVISMPAVRIGEDNELIQQPEPFRNEYELQGILADHPILLTGRDDTALVTISRELPLTGGFADIFLIDTDGLPVIALVKLARNEES